MSGPNAVWPDGTRWAVGQAHDQWMKRSQFDPTSVATDILTALEPFVQQRIADATQRMRNDAPAPAAPPPTGEPVSEGAAWVPVLVEPRTPNTESVLIHHAHRGQACVACEVAALRAENEQLRRELEAKS